MTSQAFGAWLAQQTGRDDEVGQLARIYVRPCDCGPCVTRFSRRYSIAGVRTELQDHAATRAALDALDQAASEWQTTR